MKNRTKIYLWHGKFIKAVKLRKNLGMTLHDFKIFIEQLERKGVIKNHRSGYSSEALFHGHHKVITILDRETFFNSMKLRTRTNL